MLKVPIPSPLPGGHAPFLGLVLALVLVVSGCAGPPRETRPVGIGESGSNAGASLPLEELLQSTYAAWSTGFADLTAVPMTLDGVVRVGKMPMPIRVPVHGRVSYSDNARVVELFDAIADAVSLDEDALKRCEALVVEVRLYEGVHKVSDIEIDRVRDLPTRLGRAWKDAFGAVELGGSVLRDSTPHADGTRFRIESSARTADLRYSLSVADSGAWVWTVEPLSMK